MEDSWLYHAGVGLHFGHGGHPCPSRSEAGHWNENNGLGTRYTEPVAGASSRDPDTGVFEASKWCAPTPPITDTEAEEDETENFRLDEIPEDMPLPRPPPPEAEPFGDSSPIPAWTSRKDLDGNPLVVVVDRTGMHLFPAFWCECCEPVPHELQALDMGFYPASHKSIRTLFTFQCLDDFLADNQECNTTAYHYIEKLRRLTNSSFPQTAPVRSQFLTGDSTDYVT